MNGIVPVSYTHLDAEIHIEFNGNSYTMSAGESKFPSIVLKEGINTLKLTGKATVTIEYQEGCF